ncbi:MAG: hypothetical protein KA201_03895 [Kofleriaceae bacterium]|nr:hypothetical protein [Kofleriaceae bacterium]
MKEHPTHDSPLDVRDGGYEFLDGFGSFVGSSFLVLVNRVVRIAVVPEFPDQPWPPPFPSEWDVATSRVQALHHAFATTTMTVAPARDGHAMMKAVRFPEAEELVHTAVWIDPARHRDLVAELGSLRGLPEGVSRLQLDDGPTRWLLDEVLPQVDIGAYARAMLCLPDSPT